MTNKEAKEIMSKVTFYWELGEQTLTQNQINEALDMAIKALEQQPKIGHWIVIDYQRGIFRCSTCHTEGYVNTQMYKPIWEYCPYCGARMAESEDK